MITTRSLRRVSDEGGVIYDTQSDDMLLMRLESPEKFTEEEAEAAVRAFFTHMPDVEDESLPEHGYYVTVPIPIKLLGDVAYPLMQEIVPEIMDALVYIERRRGHEDISSTPA